MTKPQKIHEYILNMGLDPEALGASHFNGVFDNDEGSSFYLSKEALSEYIERLNIGETWFFRQKGAYEHLVDSIIKRRVDKEKVKILSVPSSTGEEPYSIAIHLKEAGIPESRFEVIAADININAIQKAKEGVYHRNSFRENIPGLDKYFSKKGDLLLIAPEIKRLVDFQHINIIKESPGSDFDFIFIRNLIIYLNKDARKRLLDVLINTGSKDCIYYCGSSESTFFAENDFISSGEKGSFAYIRKASGNTEIKHEHRNIIPIISDNKTAEIPKVITRERQSYNLNDIKLYADQGEYEKALHLCEKLEQVHLVDYKYHYYKGLIHLAKDDSNSAEQCFRKALFLNPEHYDSLFNMYLISEMNGNTEQAENYKKRALKSQNEE